MRLGFVCNHNPLDKRTFSGTAYYMFHSLKKNPDCSIKLIGNYRYPNRILDRFLPQKRGIDQISSKSFEDLDVILSLVSTDLVPEVAKVTDVPVVHITDATPAFLREFYGYEVPKDRDDGERRAIESAALVYYSSDFMMEKAADDFGSAIKNKTAACPWGANLDILPKASTEKPPLKPLRLLFIGTNWERKGGDIAVEALRVLRARGIPAELHLVGAATEEAKQVEGVFVHGYLNKNRQSHRKRLQKLLQESHFFLLPTRADCTPMVVAEVNSYSIPVLISDVGGIGSLMKPGENGEMMSPHASGQDYADKITALIEDPEEYKALSHSSFDHYNNRLSWHAWADHTLKLLDKKLGSKNFDE